MRGKKIPLQHRNYVLHIYLTQGYTAATAVAKRYGFGAAQVSKIAREAGHANKPGPESGVWKDGVNTRATA